MTTQSAVGIFGLAAYACSMSLAIIAQLYLNQRLRKQLRHREDLIQRWSESHASIVKTCEKVQADYRSLIDQYNRDIEQLARGGGA